MLPISQMDAPLQLLVTNLDYDEHKGRIAIGRVQSGTIRKGDSIVFTKPGTAASCGAGRKAAGQPGSQAGVCCRMLVSSANSLLPILSFIKVYARVLASRAGDEKPQTGRISELFVYDNFARTPVDDVAAGDICALTGLAAVSIGETICDPGNVRPLPTIEVRTGGVQASRAGRVYRPFDRVAGWPAGRLYGLKGEAPWLAVFSNYILRGIVPVRL